MSREVTKSIKKIQLSNQKSHRRPEKGYVGFCKLFFPFLKIFFLTFVENF